MKLEMFIFYDGIIEKKMVSFESEQQTQTESKWASKLSNISNETKLNLWEESLFPNNHK